MGIWDLKEGDKIRYLGRKNASYSRYLHIKEGDVLTFISLGRTCLDGG